ncbi:MAG: DNA-directed RNA polymerase subunit beta', partial [Acetobacteraceae bacterium]|nr:DNA-directed RNA polymerase subunit beta' [Acetobacteraceae bacterium]
MLDNFDSLRIGLASPDQIRQWSRGEVKKPETINYRTLKPEREGLFCEKIFGPTRDWECHCGKYKRVRYKGIICDRCGVEVTRSKVRRERMGHIELAAPVSHIWYFKGIPSRMGLLLDMSPRALEKVLYFASYVVIEPGNTPLLPRQLLTESEYRDYREKYGQAFRAGMGAEAIKKLLEQIDLEKLARELRQELKGASGQRRLRALRRLEVVEAFRKSGNSPTWMILEVIPVIPPDLRPMVQLDGGRFATSDLNDLYRRVINRNNRLKRLLDLGAPDIIVRNEKRMLQEAVDALIDNGRRGRPVTGPGNRPLKSLSDMLKGKQGRFRQNLLGKRVDYSGRSVIVVGPELKLHQCGLPKEMALELFKPFVMKKLVKDGLAHNIKSAKRMVERVRPEVWDVLEEVIREHPVLLNRAPTLHRLGIQAFEPVLVEGRAIQIHPLVCTAYNADFDGDQMAVHVPLSAEAQAEARVLMLSAHNVLNPKDGTPVVTPTQDMVLGCYYLTLAQEGMKGEGRAFGSPEEVIMAYEAGDISLHALIKVRLNGQRVETTAGRILFNERVPPQLGFINHVVDRSTLGCIVAECYRRYGNAVTAALLDGIKELGFRFATRAGTTISISDIQVPPAKDKILRRADLQVEEVEEQYRRGLITWEERYQKVIDIWNDAKDEVTSVLMEGLGRFNPIFMMATSGARGNVQQISQLAGMRGLMADPSGRIIELPIRANFREGLTVLEYFTSTHGARKGLADTALKTADSGYLTRRLVDVAQDVIVSEYDCGTVKYIEATPLVEGGDIIQSLRDRVIGRVAAEDIRDPLTGEIIVQVNTEITEELAQKIEDAGIERVRIRSALICETKRGVCVMCYGRNLGTGRLAELGEAVGIIAAQSIGEPGTQLTMRTFHIGGTASRVVEASKHEAKTGGVVRFHNLRTVQNRDGDLVATNRNGEIGIVDDRGRERERYPVVYGAKLKVRPDQKVKPRTVLVEWDPFTNPILTEFTGRVEYQDIVENVTVREEFDEVTGLARKVIIEDPDGRLQPGIIIRGSHSDPALADRHRYPLPVGAHLVVADGAEVYAADILAKIPRETTKTKDITGCLPRVAELFEA